MKRFAKSSSSVAGRAALGAWAVVSAFSQPAGKVVFLLENEVVTAKDDGSDVKALTKDKAKKSQPSWSPDGSRISYLTAGNPTSKPTRTT
jgi:hypothetical protein